MVFVWPIVCPSLLVFGWLMSNEGPEPSMKLQVETSALDPQPYSHELPKGGISLLLVCR